MKKRIVDWFGLFKTQAVMIMLFTVASYGVLINNLNLWLDEIYSVLMAKGSFSEMWQMLVTEDSKPPLYYLYLKMMLALFPKSIEIWGAHFASVLLLLVAQIFAMTTVRKDYGEKPAIILMLLVMLMPASLWLAFEVRTYMLSSLLLLMVAVYGNRLPDHPQNSDFIKFGTASLLALYSHYYCAIWLMFFYAGILFILWRQRKFHKSGKKFLLTSGVVAILFLPWLYVPFHTAGEISKYWYVSKDFVRFSWEFLVNPLKPEIIQSHYTVLTTLATAAFSFVLIVGLFNSYKDKHWRLFILSVGSFAATYLLLWGLSWAIRPMVTARYLKIFSLGLFIAGAMILCRQKNLLRAFLSVAVMGFVATYADIRFVSFDNGYQAVIRDIRKFIPKSEPILVFDNSNLFCEYYLPEYKCLLIHNDVGEVLRKQKVYENFNDYDMKPSNILFSLSVYNGTDYAESCQVYKSFYRFGQNVTLCRYAPENAILLLKSTKELLKQKMKTP